MVKKLLWWILATLIIVFVIAWIWTGGLSRAKDTGKTFTNVINFVFYNGTSTDISLRLPWQSGQAATGDTFSELARQAYGNSSEQDDLSSLNSEYDKLNSQITESKTFGDPSPLRGQVRMANEGAAKDAAAQVEYIEIVAGGRNTAPIDISGWSLQSAY